MVPDLSCIITALGSLLHYERNACGAVFRVPAGVLNMDMFHGKLKQSFSWAMWFVPVQNMVVSSALTDHSFISPFKYKPWVRCPMIGLVTVICESQNSSASYSVSIYFAGWNLILLKKTLVWNDYNCWSQMPSKSCLGLWNKDFQYTVILKMTKWESR